jgi:hypothetical protein
MVYPEPVSFTRFLLRIKMWELSFGIIKELTVMKFNLVFNRKENRTRNWVEASDNSCSS